MGQVLDFCFSCENKRGCDTCENLHEWIVAHRDRELQRPEAEWTDYGDGIYCCSHCGMPAGWSHPALAEQSLGEFCEHCGAKMSNGYAALGNQTPREMVRAAWIQKRKGAHQYFCAVCGGKESSPREWCPRCGTHMDDGAWEKRWAVRKEWEAGGEVKASILRESDVGTSNRENETADRRKGNMVVLYSTGCPRCAVLEKKLETAGVPYEKCTSVDKMLSLGMTQAPALGVGDKLLDFGAANEWLNNRKLEVV